MNERRASAQVAQDPHPLQLSAQAQEVLKALDSVGSLPAEGWRVHDGDLPHGEAVGLDDSAWPVMKNNAESTVGTMWFRRTIVVPERLNGYDLTGAKIEFEFSIWAEGPVPLIVYFDGRRVAMGEALEPISLFENAKPGDRILVAVKALETAADAKHFGNAYCKVTFPPGRPSPSTVRLEALAATNLIPALEQDKTLIERRRATLEDALKLVDLAALKAGDQKGFDQSLQAAQSGLESLRTLMQQAQFHLTGDAHIDAAWVWPWTDTVDVARRTFGTALQLMREYPDYTFSQSAAAYFDWMAEKYPALDKGIQERVKDGRWEMVGGMWVEPDLNMPDGESLVRQLLIGKRFIRSHYGVDVRVGWNPDSFGYNWQLPQIYKKSGIDYFVTQKMDWNETNRLPLKLFYWQSPDGSRVLTYFPHNYTNFIEPDGLARDFNVARQYNPGAREMMHLYGIGDHGGGPTRAMLDEAQVWMQKDKVFSPMRYGTAEAFFKEMQPKLDVQVMPVWNYQTLASGDAKLQAPKPGMVSLPVWNDELYLEYTRGAYTSQARQKKNMREAERELLDAEKWSAADWLRGAAYPADALNEAWKKALFNQFHDIAAGSSIGAVYKDAERDYEWVRYATSAAQSKAMDDLASGMDTAAGGTAGSVPVVVWNSLAWQRTGVVEAEVQLPETAKAVEIADAGGRAVPAQALADETNGRQRIAFLASDLPSLGWRVFHARAAKHVDYGGERLSLSVAQIDGGFALENEKLKVVIDAQRGCITHLIDKESGFDAIATGGCGNELQSFVDKPKDYDAWNIDPGTLDHPTAMGRAESVAMGERGPVRASVLVVHKMDASTIAQEIRLAADADFVEVLSKVAWHERHVLLKAAFPLAASGPTATFEIPYGSIERPTTRGNSWDAAKFEVPALRWADLGDGQHGLSLLNDSKYGYDAVGNVLRLSLLRSPTAPDPDADQGMHEFAYALYPHAGSWRSAETMRRGYEFNDALKAAQASAHNGTLPSSDAFITVKPRNVLLTAMKKCEDADALLLRFYEWEGKAGTAIVSLPRKIASATLTNLMEEPEGVPLKVSGNQVAVPFGPHSIVTLRVSFIVAR